MFKKLQKAWPRFAAFAALAGFVFPISAPFTSSFQLDKQVEKDRKVFQKLESELRSELDGLLKDFTGVSKDIPLPPQVEASNLESSYDKFKDVTTVSIGMSLHHAFIPPKVRADGSLKDYLADVDLYAAYSYSGQQPVKPISFTLMLKSTASGPLFGINPSLIFLADGKRMRLGNMQERTVYHERGIVDEFVSADIPGEVFAVLANANSVEAQIGQIEFSLSEPHLKGLRLIAGLPDRQPSTIDPKTSGSGNADITGTTWRGDKFSGQFKKDGEVILEGWFAERMGTWKQNQDRVELVLPSPNAGQARILGIGIISGSKMAIKFTVQSLFGGSTVTSVMQT